jgi:hypothetical protein
MREGVRGDRSWEESKVVVSRGTMATQWLLRGAEPSHGKE